TACISAQSVGPISVLFDCTEHAETSLIRPGSECKHDSPASVSARHPTRTFRTHDIAQTRHQPGDGRRYRGAVHRFLGIDQSARQRARLARASFRLFVLAVSPGPDPG